VVVVLVDQIQELTVPLLELGPVIDGLDQDPLVVHCATRTILPIAALPIQIVQEEAAQAVQVVEQQLM